MRMLCRKAKRRAIRNLLSHAGMARQGNMRRKRPGICRESFLSNGTKQHVMQPLQRRFAFYAQNQNAIFRASKVRKAIQRQPRRGK